MQALLDGSVAAPMTRACDAVGISRATVHRRRRPRATPCDPSPDTATMSIEAKQSATTERPRPRSPRALDETERQRVLDALHSPKFVDQAPREVYAQLLSAGIYIASVRTMYRVLASLGETGERRRGHEHKRHAIPQLEAFAPNEVWTWDITKVPSFVPSVFFYVFVVLDLFSRMVVGWMVADAENAENAGHLLRETIRRHGIEPGSLTVHSDRGSPMKAGTTTALLTALGVEYSFSRPRVSNDNPFIESSFKTAKYQPDYPGKFATLEHTRAYFAEFFDWYCEHHHHEGLALFTPADVFYGRVESVAAVRQRALDAQYDAHPERFVRGRPVVARPRPRVHINVPLIEPAPATALGSNEVAVPDAVAESSPPKRNSARARPESAPVRGRAEWTSAAVPPAVPGKQRRASAGDVPRQVTDPAVRESEVAH
jgi:putative transposase